MVLFYFFERESGECAWRGRRKSGQYAATSRTTTDENEPDAGRWIWPIRDESGRWLAMVEGIQGFDITGVVWAVEGKGFEGVGMTGEAGNVGGRITSMGVTELGPFIPSLLRIARRITICWYCSRDNSPFSCMRRNRRNISISC